MIKSLFTSIADIILGGSKSAAQPAQSKPELSKPLPEILFYPVLFANGRDDDSEALKAFYENRPYVFQGKLFEPTRDERVLEGLQLRISADAVVFIKDGRVKDYVGDTRGKTLTVSVSHGLHRCVARCSICMSAKVQP